MADVSFLDPSEIREEPEDPCEPYTLCVQHWERKDYVCDGIPFAVDEDGNIYPADDEESDSDDDTDDEMDDPNEHRHNRRRPRDYSTDSDDDTDDEDFNNWADGVMADARQRRRLNEHEEETDSSDDEEGDESFNNWVNQILANARQRDGGEQYSSDEEEEDECQFATV